MDVTIALPPPTPSESPRPPKRRRFIQRWKIHKEHFEPVVNFDDQVMEMRDSPIVNTMRRIDAEETKPKVQRAWYCGPFKGTSAKKALVYADWLCEESQMLATRLQHQIATEPNPYRRNMLICVEWCMCPPVRMRARVKAVCDVPPEKRAEAVRRDSIRDNLEFRRSLKEIKFILVCRRMDERSEAGISEEELSDRSSSSSDEYNSENDLIVRHTGPPPDLRLLELKSKERCPSKLVSEIM